MFKKVVVGGTFNRLHKGHQVIIDSAFRIGESVVIGLTSDEFAARFRAINTYPYSKRERQLKEYIKKLKEKLREDKSYQIIKIEDSYGIATIDPDIDCIVVSEETLLRAEEINAIRFKKGLNKINILVIPIVLADDRKPISGERIEKGEIDKYGRILKK